MKTPARILVACVAALALVLVSGCSVRPRARPERVTLRLGAYTTPKEVYETAIIPRFQARWKARTGQEVDFQQSYRPSGLQARAILGEYEADVAALSLETDIAMLADAGLVTHDWKSRPGGGIVTRSIVVIAVRPGNPLNVRDWSDLARPGVRLVTPDPRTSGGGRWNVNAIYGAALRGRAGTPTRDAPAAENFLRDVLRNVVAMDTGARESMARFESGEADAAVTYENEVLAVARAGRVSEYVVPTSTILVENPVALVDRHVDKHGTREVAEAFVDFLRSTEAQQAFAESGLRPADEAVLGETGGRFRPVQDLFTIGYFGGWKRAAEEVYGADGVFTRVFAEAHGGE